MPRSLSRDEVDAKLASGDFDVLGEAMESDDPVDAALTETMFSRLALLAAFEDAIIKASKYFGWHAVRERDMPDLLAARWRIFDTTGHSGMVDYDLRDWPSESWILLPTYDEKWTMFTRFWARVRRNTGQIYKAAGITDTLPRGRRTGYTSDDLVRYARLADQWEKYDLDDRSIAKFMRDTKYSRYAVNTARRLRREGKV